MRYYLCLLSLILVASAAWSQDLVKKPNDDFGTSQPCTEAIEDIAEEVNRRQQ